MNESFKNIVLTLKKINKKIIDATNLILLLPVYFIGAGFTYLLWKLSHREKHPQKRTYWINSSNPKEKLGEYLKQF